MTIGYGSQFVETTFREGLIYEAERSTFTMAFSSRDDEYTAFMIQDRPGNGRGDTVKVRFARHREDDNPKSSTAQVLGQEAEGETLEDEVSLRYGLFDGVVPNLPANQDLVSFNLKAKERSRLARQWSETFEKWVIRQLAGYTPVNSVVDYLASGGNKVEPQDSRHHLYAPDAGGANPTEADVAADATSVMTTDLINHLVTRATSKVFTKWPTPPCTTPWGHRYVLLVHGTGYQQIRDNSSSNDFLDIAKAEIQGGQGSAYNTLITGEGFIYNNTLVLRSDFCPPGVNDAGTGPRNFVRRAVFFGACAGTWVFGEGFTDGDYLGWSEHIQHRRWSCIADTIAGFKRLIPKEDAGRESFGSWVVSHYSAPEDTH